MKNTNLILAAVSAMALIAGAAGAQTAAPAAPAAPTPPTFGAAVPGQCVLDTQSAMADSAMGKAAADRLGQLKAQVDSELQSQSAALDTEYKTLASTQKAQAATPTTKTAWEGKAQAWSQKRDAFQQKVQQRQQEMQYTQQEVMAAIFQKMVPSINAVVTTKSCATVIQADSLLHYEAPGANNAQPTSFVYANPSMNITQSVIQKMDASGELLPSFDRVSLDQQQGAPAAPRPATAPAAGAAPKK